jgi:hypothetical protein
MKLALALFIIAGILSPAAAQEGAAPAQPAASEPAMPSQDKPAMPSQDKPAMPSQDKPAMPSQDKPAMPSQEEPAQPGRISEWVDTTPKALQSPENIFFRPFHVQGSTLTLMQVTVDKEMTIDGKTGEKRLYTLPELKKKQALELKTLRKSLIKRPNSEIRKAVKARETEQKTELKSLQNRIRSEAEKNQKMPPQPKPVITPPVKAE